MAFDCDVDALRITVRQKGEPPVRPQEPPRTYFKPSPRRIYASVIHVPYGGSLLMLGLSLELSVALALTE